LVLGGNPVFTAPADVPFAAGLKQVTLSVHQSLYYDETSALCHWHIPEAHYLEAWSDARAFDGTAAIVQPLIAPLYDGKSAHELLAACTEQAAQAEHAAQAERSGYTLVRDYWQRRLTSGAQHPQAASVSHDFERTWRQALREGVIPDTALAPKP